MAYTGVHGFSQRLETIICAAELLTNYKDIQFIFWGDGPEKPGLEAMVQAKHLSNVQFSPSQPASRMPELLTSVDVSVVPLARTELSQGALPSKLFEALGAECPSRRRRGGAKLRVSSKHLEGASSASSRERPKDGGGHRLSLQGCWATKKT